jgi:hypothetical protein
MNDCLSILWESESDCILGHYVSEFPALEQLDTRNGDTLCPACPAKKEVARCGRQ